ncbi:MAG: hypothetical protein ACRYGG_03775 [Janthinobacterium lividum]
MRKFAYQFASIAALSLAFASTAFAQSNAELHLDSHAPRPGQRTSALGGDAHREPFRSRSRDVRHNDHKPTRSSHHNDNQHNDSHGNAGHDKHR